MQMSGMQRTEDNADRVSEDSRAQTSSMLSHGLNSGHDIADIVIEMSVTWAY